MEKKDLYFKVWQIAKLPEDLANECFEYVLLTGSNWDGLSVTERKEYVIRLAGVITNSRNTYWLQSSYCLSRLDEMVRFNSGQLVQADFCFTLKQWQIADGSLE